MAKRISVSNKVDNIERQLDVLSKRITEHIGQEDDKLECIKKQIQGISAQVNDIQNIKVNGSVGLKEILTNLYYLSNEKRMRYKMYQDFKIWRDKNQLARFLLGSHFGIAIFTIVNIFVALSIAHVLGANVDPIQMIKGIFWFISKFF